MFVDDQGIDDIRKEGIGPAKMTEIRIPRRIQVYTYTNQRPNDDKLGKQLRYSDEGCVARTATKHRHVRTLSV